MKKFRTTIEKYIQRADNSWKALSVRKQKSLTKLFLGIYCLLTLVTLTYIWFETANGNNILSISHIQGIPQNVINKAHQNE
ncbi:hypothetical protein EG349_00905 [Chryseobacterium shandongense]|uniref:Nitrogen regulatory IIA protein n=1 Tax=Chryseobacterium shandongense TaxID=1493872 RepID=A0AAD0YDB8_9FLAO|nr:hypothetical protein [Chryseobacterium shandongense]AZA85448.1 hypothetical protein EG349_00905 [Chryseobacterium shandongense]AZA97555.1 hypothetical protein EG353_19375 [Chryseobacterium shandongense]